MPRKTPSAPTLRADRTAPRSFAGLEQLEQRLAMSTVYWDGGGDGVTLTDKKNWECNRLPGVWDTAVIDVAANPEIQHNGGSFTVKKLILNEQLMVSGGTLNAWALTTIKPEGTLDLAGGMFTGGPMDVYGRLNWTGGKLAGCGDVEIKSGGSMWINGSGDLYLARDIVNHGSLVWAGGNIEGYDSYGTVIKNAADGLMKAIGTDTRFRSNHKPGKFINEGTFVRDGEGYARFVVPVTNSGTVNVAAGKAEFFAGGSNTGARAVAEGAVLHYFGNFSHGAGSTLTGGGTTIWQGGEHTITGSWSMDSYLYLSNATMTGDADLEIGGVFGWSHGTLAGSGGTIVKEGGKLEVRTTGEHHLARDITNDGTLIWNKGPLAFEGATVTNNEGRNFYLAAEGAATGTGDNLIVNRGEMRKVLPTAMGFDGVTLDNEGLLNIRNGSLTLDPARIAQLSEGVLSGGTWSVYGTAALDLQGATFSTVGAGASVIKIGRDAGFGSLNTIERNEGSVNVSGGGVLELTPASGTFTNNGELILRKGTTLRVLGDFVQTEVGVIDIGIASHHMLGTGRMISAQRATLGGVARFTLQNDYVPSAGNTFLFVDAAELTGQFGSTEFPVTPGLAGTLTYTGTGARLVFATL